MSADNFYPECKHLIFKAKNSDLEMFTFFSFGATVKWKNLLWIFSLDGSFTILKRLKY